MSTSVAAGPAGVGRPGLSSSLARYLRWLHLQWPAGTVEKLPEVRPHGSTNVPGLYVVGDLTGVPLLKFSSDSGARAVQTIDQVLPLATSLSADSAYHAAKILYDNGRNETARKILESKLASDSVFPNRGDAEALLNSIRNP